MCFLCHLGVGYYYPEFMNLTLIIIASGENTPLMSRFG
jgi:hypothetical protein